ncbi:MAG TPA: BCCT family transporter, partial [Actinomycetales bacterium]|nr:BCCT family transporter [Actinomycetales bacterium]
MAADENEPIEPSNLYLDEMRIEDEDSDSVILDKLRRHGMRVGKGMIAPAVFWPILIVVVGLVIFAIVAPDLTAIIFKNIDHWIVTNLSWYYMLAIGIFIAVAIYLGMSKVGKIRLGREGEEPEFGTLSWFAMLFAAGMGIGLVFYSVGEPLSYFTTSPKPGWSGSEAEIAQKSMAQTFLHWGL